MTGVRVTSLDGTVWTVRRRWLPHRDGKGLAQRFRRNRTRRGLDALDGVDLPFDFDLAGIAIAIGLLLAFVGLLLFGWPLLLLGVDLAWLLLVGVFGVLGRVVLRRPWRVESTSDGERHEWFVQGFRAAGQLRDDLADRYRHGHKPHETAPSQLPH